jgi:hypothetical protein
MIILDIEVLGGSDRYRVTHGDRLLLRSSRQPLLDGARRLLAGGVLATEEIGLRRLGGDRIDLRSSVGFAARLMVEEETRTGRPAFRRWRKLRYNREGMPGVSPPVRLNSHPIPSHTPSAKIAPRGSVSEDGVS